MPSLGHDAPMLSHLAPPLSMTRGIQARHLQDVMVQAGRLQAGGLQELIS
jgi:hypothetical protein